MSDVIFFLMVLSVAGVTLLLALAMVPRSLRQWRGKRRALGVVGGLLWAIGLAGFFAPMLSSLGVLPVPFEWPVGWADQILQCPDGRRVVLHTPSGRVQVYDQAWHFLRGWNVKASGGLFKGRLTGEDNLEVWTARGERRFVFDLNGRILSAGGYAPASYSDLPGDDAGGFVPTPWPLWVFVHPFIGLAVAIVGMVLSNAADRPRKARRKAPKPQAAPKS